MVFVLVCRLYLDGKSQNLDLKCALPHYTESFEKTMEISSGVIILLILRFWLPIVLMTVLCVIFELLMVGRSMIWHKSADYILTTKYINHESLINLKHLGSFIV